MAEPDYARVLRAVAGDIGALKEHYPQLQDFSPTDHADPKALQISYGFHTHRPQGRSGWTSGVPNPDEDGLWFYLDFHDPDSMAQIHTQPVVPKGILGKKTVMMLILEGAGTKPLTEKIWAILKRHGAKGP